MGSRGIVTRRQVMRGGLVALAGGVGAAALAACGEAEVVEKTVTVTVTEVKEVIKEVPVEVLVTKEIPVETVVIKEVQVETIKEVPVETIKEVEVERVVTKEVIKEVVLEKVVIEEKFVERAQELVPGINVFSYPDVIPLGPYDPTVGGEVSYPTFGNANSYHPLRAASRASVEIGNMIHEPLYTLGAGNDFAPLLAAGAEVQDDRTQWRLRLRNDVVFHNDEPLNADTVISNFEEIFDESIVRGGIVGFANELDRVEKVDDFTVDFFTKIPNAIFLKPLTRGYRPWPLVAKEMGEDFDFNPIGTGPFKFESWTDNVELVGTRFDKYGWAPWYSANQGPAYADRAVGKVLSNDSTARINAMEAGEVSFLLHFVFPHVQRISTNPSFRVLGILNEGMPQYMPINTQLFPTDDVEVRRAMIEGIDRRTVTVRANGGVPPVVVSNCLTSEAVKGYNPEVNNLYTFDVSKAQARLDAAGWTLGDDGFRYNAEGQLLEIVFPDTGYPVRELFKLDVEQSLGISVQIPRMEGSTFNEQMQNGAFHAGYVGIGGPDGDVLWDRFHTSVYGLPGRAYSRWMYTDPPGEATPGVELDALLDGARIEFDPAKQIELWQRASHIIMDNALMIPFVTEFLSWIANTDIVGGNLFVGNFALPIWSDWYDKRVG